MKLKYRIKKRTYLSTESTYISQYRFLGIWMNINMLHTGNFFVTNSTICESLDEAENRIAVSKLNMERAKEIITRTTTYIKVLN